MTTRSIRLDRMQAGLVAWVSAVLPSATVAWGRTKLPREVAGQRLATFRVVSGPRSAGQGSASVRPWRVIEAASVTITDDIVEGASAGIIASGIKVEHTASAGESRGDVRDALLALLQASDIDATFTAADNGVSILITPTSPGDVTGLIALGSATTAFLPYYGSLVGSPYGGQSGATLTDRKVQIDEATYRIELQISDKRPEPMNGAGAAMAELFASTDLPPMQNVRDQYGLRVDMGTPINLDRLSGPDWESREVVDLNVTLMSISAAQATRMVQVFANIDARHGNAIIAAVGAAAAES